MSQSNSEEEMASPTIRKRAFNKSTREPTNALSTINVREIRAHGSFEKKVDHQYSKQLQYQMKKNWIEEDEIWSKSLLAFILAIQNSQIKTANFFVSGNEKIRRIIHKLHIVFDQAHGYESRTPEKDQNTFQNKQKVKVINDSEDSDQDQENDSQDESKKKIIKLKSMGGEAKKKKGSKELDISDSSFSDIGKETKPKTDKDSAMSKERRQKKNTDAGSDNKLNQNSQPFNQDSQDSIDQVLINNMYDIEKLQQILVSDAALKFNTNILKIALNFEEDKVAAIIIANYPLYSMFYHNQNEVFDPTIGDDNATVEQRAAQDQIKYFNIEDLMEKVNQFFAFKEAESILQKIMHWRIHTEENILKILIDLGHERVAVIFMDDFHYHSTWDFFWHCIINEKQLFLKHALREQYFNLDYAYQQQLIEWALEEMKSGKNLLYPLNILLFSDFRKWEIENLKELRFVANLNLIILDFNVLDVECQRYLQKFSILGRKIIEGIQFDQVETIFMDRDFKDRSVLTIICESQIMSYIVIGKLRFLIDKIWDGANSDMIDGKTSHYSRTKYLLYHEIKNIKGVPVSIKDIMGDNFKPNTDDYNFIFQNKFRQQSIFIIFLKDFVCATFIVCVFQYINYSYLNLFTQRRYENLPDYESQLALIKENLATYNKFNFVGTILSASYFVTFLYRCIYNAYSRRKIYGDIWMIFDLMSGTISIAAFNIVGMASPEKLWDQNEKRWLDYYMIIALIIAWLRFFSYFLVINNISKVTLTLFMMLKEALNFLIVLGLYLVLMTTVFATMFRDCNTADGQDYHSLWYTGRDMIDYFLANFPETKDMGAYNTSHSVMLMIHITISNLFMLNFLIAILSTIYDIMINNGDFYAIKYQYSFITKYMKSMEENNGYHVLVQYPPPLNFFVFPLLFVFLNRQKTRKVAKCITQFFFWFENFFFIIVFFLYLMAHNPFIIFKIYFQIITKIEGVWYKIFHFFIWTVTGFFTCLVINVADTGMLISILCANNSIQYDHSEDEKNKLLKLQYYIYRDIFRSMRQLNAIAESTSFLFHKRQNLQRMFTQKMTITERMQNDFGDFKIDDLFIMRKELIIAVYEQIAQQNPYILAFRRACYQFPNRKGSAAILNDLEVDMKEVKEKDKEDPQMSADLRTIIGKMILSHNRDNLTDLIEYMQEERNKMDNKIMQITDQELRIINSCLSRFTLQQKNQENTTINLSLVLKALPKVFTKSSIKQIELFNFQKVQKILITFFNTDQDEMFNYFDNRMNRRLITLKKSSVKNSMIVDKILNIAKDLFSNSQLEEAMHKVATFHTVNNQPSSISSNKTKQNGIVVEQLQSAFTQKSNGNPMKKNTQVSFQIDGENPSYISYRDSVVGPNAEMIQHMGTIGDNTARQIEEVLMSDEPFEVMEFLMKEEKKALNRVLAYKQKQEYINMQTKVNNLIPEKPQIDITSVSMNQNIPQINLNSPDSPEKTVQQKKSNTNVIQDAPVTPFEPMIDKRKLQMQALAHLQTKLPKNMPTADQILTQIREKRRVTRKETNLSNDDMNDASVDDNTSDFVDSNNAQRKNTKKKSSGNVSKKSRHKSIIQSIHQDSFKSDLDESLEIQS